jgi:mono/diheme cytochrome c family protein
MENSGKNKNFKLKKIAVPVTFTLLMVALTAFGISTKLTPSNDYKKVPDVAARKKDSVASVKAFAKVYSVLMSPRCMNCHPKGDVPLQGEDSHIHTMQPKRGTDGKGLYAMKCANCHQPENTPGVHTPPGNPKWQLPPADMKMVFEGRTAHQLAIQIMDFNQNGHKDMKKLIEHVDDTLVKAGWHPSQGLKQPPLSHKEFKKAWITWLETGAYAPKK